MAEEETTTEEQEQDEEQEGQGGKKKLIIIAVIALLVLGGGGGAAMMFMGGDDTELADDGEATEEAAEEDAPAPNNADAVYIALEPAFVVNFRDKKNRTKFLKAELSVVTFDEETQETVKRHMPAIRNKLVLLFSRQTYEELLPHEGKENLRAEALTQVNSVVESELGKAGVGDLFFTSFVIQ